MRKLMEINRDIEKLLDDYFTVVLDDGQAIDTVSGATLEPSYKVTIV